MQPPKKLPVNDSENNHTKPLQTNPGIFNPQLSDLDKIIFKIHEQKANAKTFIRSHTIRDPGELTIYMNNRQAG